MSPFARENAAQAPSAPTVSGKTLIERNRVLMQSIPSRNHESPLNVKRWEEEGRGGAAGGGGGVEGGEEEGGRADPLPAR